MCRNCEREAGVSEHKITERRKLKTVETIAETGKSGKKKSILNQLK